MLGIKALCVIDQNLAIEDLWRNWGIPRIDWEQSKALLGPTGEMTASAYVLE
jgi:hypothetical protein